MSISSIGPVIQKQEILLPDQRGMSVKKTDSIGSHLDKEKAPPLISSGPFTRLPLCSQSSYKSTMPYVLCNETSMEETLSFLKTKTIHCSSSIHIGFSVWFNYDIISVTNPSLAIVCDIDNHVLQIFKIISNCLTRSSSRKSFIQNIKNDLSPLLKEAWGLSTEQDIQSICNLDAELNRPLSWLSTENQFLLIKTMHAEGKILYQNLDLTDCTGKFSQIASWIQSQSLQTSTLYVSNILEWIQTASMQKQEQALKNLRTLTPTFFIQSYSSSHLNKKNGPQQHITEGSSSIQLPKFLQKSR